MSPAEVTAEYVKQIMEAVHEKDESDAAYIVGELLKEYGARAYREGRRELAVTVSKLVS